MIVLENKLLYLQSEHTTKYTILIIQHTTLNIQYYDDIERKIQCCSFTL